MAVWVREMYEDAYERRQELETLLDDPDLRQEDKRRYSAQLRKMHIALGEADPTKGEDPLVDMWEAQMARGEVPDLDAKMPTK